jgi:hypothetical protein
MVNWASTEQRTILTCFNALSAEWLTANRKNSQIQITFQTNPVFILAGSNISRRITDDMEPFSAAGSLWHVWRSRLFIFKVAGDKEVQKAGRKDLGPGGHERKNCGVLWATAWRRFSALPY